VTDYKQKAQELLKEINLQSIQYWQEKQVQLLNLIINGDIRNFRSWVPLTDTMEITVNNYIGLEYGALPPKFIANLKEQSNTGIHQAYHLSQLSDYSDVKSVFEFGGGYGCLRKVFDQVIGPADYTIFDFPTLNLIQEYYLEGIDNTTLLNTSIPEKEVDLFIAMWSISECPATFRNEVFSKVKAKKYLIAFQEEIEGIDNTTYFKDLQIPGVKFTIKKIDHLYGGQFYMIGERI